MFMYHRPIEQRLHLPPSVMPDMITLALEHHEIREIIMPLVAVFVMHNMVRLQGKVLRNNSPR